MTIQLSIAHWCPCAAPATHLCWLPETPLHPTLLCILLSPLVLSCILHLLYIRSSSPSRLASNRSRLIQATPGAVAHQTSCSQGAKQVGSTWVTTRCQEPPHDVPQRCTVGLIAPSASKRLHCYRAAAHCCLACRPRPSSFSVSLPVCSGKGTPQVCDSIGCFEWQQTAPWISQKITHLGFCHLQVPAPLPSSHLQANFMPHLLAGSLDGTARGRARPAGSVTHVTGLAANK